MLYAPGAQARIATLQLRDGTRRTVDAREMTSGRLIEQICLGAREIACHRRVRGGDGTLEVADIRDSVTDALARMRSTLTIHNVRAWLGDAPADLDIVSVTPERAKVARGYRYVRAA